MPTPVVFTGFEFGTPFNVSGGPFDGVTGTLGTDLQVVAGSPSGVGAYVGQVSLNNKNYFWNTTALGAGKTDLVVSLRFRFTTLPTGDTDIHSIDLATGSDKAGFFFRASDAKIVAWTTGPTQASTIAVSLNTWYTLQFRYSCSAATNTFDWTLNGAAQTQVTVAGAATTVTRYALGNRSAGTGIIQWDDVVVSTTSGDYPLAMYQVRLLTADTGGTATEIGAANSAVRFTANATLDGSFNSANILTAVSEVPPLIGATATGVALQTVGAGNAVSIPMTNYTLTGGETVAGCRVCVCGWAQGTGVNNLSIRGWDGTSETSLHADVPTAFTNDTVSPTWFAGMYAGVVDQTTLNALEVRLGYSSDLTPPSGAHVVYAELLTLPGAGGSDANVSDPAAPGIFLGGSPATTAADIQTAAQPGIGVRLGVSPATTAADIQVGDPAAPGVLLGGSPATTAADRMAADPPAPGVLLGASPAGTAADILVQADVGGVRLGVSPATTSVTSSVNVDVFAPSRGILLGSSSATVRIDGVVHDLMVMPIALNAHACLVTEVGKLAFPPSSVHIRPGAIFTPLADQTEIGDECCNGIAWVRLGQQVPTGAHWPDQLTDVDPPARGVPSDYAVQIELGIIRCVPTHSNLPAQNGQIPTAAQWLQSAQEFADDAAALRRTVCCLQVLYGTDAVLAGVITPLQNEGNCGGQTVLIQVRAPACDCLE